MTERPSSVTSADGTVLVRYLAKQIDIQASKGKTQRQIAQEMGYVQPNMLSMLKHGRAKVPLEKIPELAKALEADAGLIFRLAMRQYWPDIDKAVSKIFGTVLTKNETKIVEVVREVTDGCDPDLTDDLECRLRAIFAA